MSDNITREPYRNAWYKQLSDAVKKHDEEIAEMTPHLVPDVEEGDNGKILIAGEEGAFDWGQPPEELPVITEGDEGKVLKVDEGVPKWLDDKDAEIPSHTSSDEGKMLSVNAQNALEWKDVPTEIPEHTASDEGKMLSVNAQNGVEWKDVPKELPTVTSADEGEVLMVNGSGNYIVGDDVLIVTLTESSGTYTADKTYAEIEKYGLKGKCILLFGARVCNIDQIAQGTGVRFVQTMLGYNGKNIVNNNNNYFEYVLQRFYTFMADGRIVLKEQKFYAPYRVNIENNTTLSDFEYEFIQKSTGSESSYPITLAFLNGTTERIFLQPSCVTTSGFEFVNVNKGYKAVIDFNKHVTITTI